MCLSNPVKFNIKVEYKSYLLSNARKTVVVLFQTGNTLFEQIWSKNLNDQFKL